ncbi:MAG TPA: hypothetical protein VF104_12880, partial [Burkholderiales bacterium]
MRIAVTQKAQYLLPPDQALWHNSFDFSLKSCRAHRMERGGRFCRPITSDAYYQFNLKENCMNKKLIALAVAGAF